VVAGAGCLILSLVAAAPASAQVELLKQWGGANGGFVNPVDIATDAAGNVYVADGPNSRVQKFTTEGEFLTQWGSFGSDNGEFESPHGIVVGPQGFVYVVDTDLARVQLFTTNGQFLDLFGEEGSGDGQLDIPLGVTTSAVGNIYVTEEGNQRVQKFTPTGGLLLEWGSGANFATPDGIAVDGGGNVYVVDRGNANVQKFDAAGDPIATFSSFGAAGALDTPFGITADPAGNLYVVDNGNDRVLHITPQGGLIGQLPGTFGNPLGAASDCRGNVYVTDRTVVKKFGDPDDPPPPCTPPPSPPGLQLEVDALKRQKVKKLALTVRCQLEACFAEMGGKVKGKVKARIAGQEGDLEAGQPRTFELGYQGGRTVRRLRSALRKKKVQRKARADLTVIATDAEGSEDTEEVNVKLRR
jgi:DNA-binding beta-propeller fold protein YncE